MFSELKSGWVLVNMQFGSMRVNGLHDEELGLQLPPLSAGK